MSRLPDFLGGPVFLGGWLETGSAFDARRDAEFTAHTSVALVGDTLIGPVIAGAGFGFHGSNRFYVGVGRIFR